MRNLNIRLHGGRYAAAHGEANRTVLLSLHRQFLSPSDGPARSGHRRPARGTAVARDAGWRRMTTVQGLASEIELNEGQSFLSAI